MFALNSVQEAHELILICEAALENEFLKVLELWELQNEVVSQYIIREIDTDKRVSKEAQDLNHSIDLARL